MSSKSRDSASAGREFGPAVSMSAIGHLRPRPGEATRPLDVRFGPERWGNRPPTTLLAPHLVPLRCRIAEAIGVGQTWRSNMTDRCRPKLPTQSVLFRQKD